MKRDEIQSFSRLKKHVKARQWPGVTEVWLASCPKCGGMLLFNHKVYECMDQEGCGYGGSSLAEFAEEMAKHPKLKPVRDLKRICRRREARAGLEKREESGEEDARCIEPPVHPPSF